jgi:predicted O-methyltransferase YrrM
MATFADRLSGFPRWVTEQYWIETHRSIATAPAHPGAFRQAWRKAKALVPQVAQVSGATEAEVRGWLREIRGHGLAREIRDRCPKASGMGGPHTEILYLFTRAARPKTVVETGVELGVSSAYFLQALKDNGGGDLWSIDLPTLGPGGRINADGRVDKAHVDNLSQVGAAVPDRLRPHWHLELGDAKHLLTSIAAPAPWDIFFHDSEHSRSHMLWEYETAWPRIRPGGFLLSDDVPDNDAFVTFAQSVKLPPFLWLRRGTLRKPAVPPAVSAPS